MCPGLSGAETTRDEWQRFNPVNDVVLYQAFSQSHEGRSRHKSRRISQPHYFSRQNYYVFKSNDDAYNKQIRIALNRTYSCFMFC